MIERNNEESKYNPLIQSLLSTNKYLKYDENQCKYFIDETTYKLSVFEDRYATYMKQLPMMIEGLQYYGYVTNVIDHEKEISEDRLEFIEDYLKSCRHMRFNQVTVETLDFLDHVMMEILICIENSFLETTTYSKMMNIGNERRQQLVC